MKKIILLLIGGLLLTSCVDKKKDATETSEESNVVKDNYAVVFEAIYEKDDEVLMIFKKDGFWDYDHPSTYKIVGDTAIQKLTFDLPKSLSVENIQIDLSSNKEQETLKLTGINLYNNGQEIINGSNMGFVKYFLTGTGLGWDEKNLRYNLIFGGEYPPRIVGNELLESMLVK